MSACALPGEVALVEYAASLELVAARRGLEPYLARRWVELAVEQGSLCVRASHFVGVMPFRCDARACPAGGAHVLCVLPKGCERVGGELGMLRFAELLFLADGRAAGADAAPRAADGARAGWTGERGGGAGARFTLVLAAHYATLLRELCLRDFRRYYRPEQGELRGALRGRVDAARHAANVARGRGHRVPCRWEEFTPDNWDNRVLAAAARGLVRAAGALDAGAGAVARRMFAPVDAWFSQVDAVDVGVEDLDRVRLGRVSRHYGAALAWAKLVIRGMRGVSAGGSAPALVVDADEAFERLAVAVARTAADGLAAAVRVEAQRALDAPIRGAAKVRPDVTIVEAGEVRAVGDAKYKDVLSERREGGEFQAASRAALRAADVNQLYVYMRVAGAARGFFVVPYWDEREAADASRLEEPAFAVSPLDQGTARVAVLGVNLLRPVAIGRRDAAARLASWLTE